MNNLTKEELKIKERCEKATPGPWWQQYWGGNEPPAEGARELSTLLCYFDDEGKPRFWNWQGDGFFVAHARTDIPTLLNTISLLREEKERASDLIKRLADDVEAEVKATYDRKLDFPDMRRRFDRDMAIVHEARALLSASTIPGAKAEETASAERCQAEFERYCLEAESWPEISVVKNPDGSYVVVDTQHCYHWWEAAFHTVLSLRTKEQP